ncbi:MAG: DUF1501 domain-containing protein [Planctomyces sp.]|nr:DUF1501 domain-containing protein [Planctomyces sp.]
MNRPGLCSRRHFLFSSAFGLGTLGALDLLQRDGLLAASGPPSKPEDPQTFDLLPKAPHFEPRARAMISIFLIGGPSQIDLFDYKPRLKELDGQDFPGQVQYDNPAQASRKVLGPPWPYRRYGECGMEMAELLPHIGGVADDICLIRSMHSAVNNHLPGMYALNTGKGVGGRATLGSWLTYGLGSETQDLPAFVAMTDPRGLPLIGGENWTNGPLPSTFQGTVARPRNPRILNLDAQEFLRGRPQAAQLDLLRTLNANHLEQHPGESDLAARIASYELAARMQLAAKEAFDISQETEETQRLYGIDDPTTNDYGTRCLIARRLIERGVRYVQLWNQGQSWDHHSSIGSELPNRCREVDQPSAALVSDLKRRGLLDSTVVHWGGEMGRLPTIQVVPGSASDRVGRDHNTHGFAMWVAGGGFQKGLTYGETDEFSHHAVENVVHHTDWLATLLNQFGLDHSQLSYVRNNQLITLLDGQDARVVREILA